MSNRAVVIWLVAGFPISVIDAWLSVQSMFGLLSPTHAIGYLVAIGAGICLTVFAVYVPIVRGQRTSPVLVLIWVVAFTVDVLTSILGVIWYGAIGEPLNVPINVSELHFEPANTVATITVVGFVLVVAVCCIKFGQALNELNRRHRTRRATQPRAATLGPAAVDRYY